MHIVIMGCGRVGSRLAHTLDEMGHSVAVVDQDPTAFRRLASQFRGSTVPGVGFDRDTLIDAGIERASAFAAVSSGDNSNILAARVARETFGVENVVARIYDPRRAEVYERLGIPTVATVSWTAGQMLRRLVPLGSQEDWRDASGTVVLSELAYAESWIGVPVEHLGAAAGARIAFLTRYGEGLLPRPDTVVQEGDLVHVLYPIGRRDHVEQVFARGPAEESA